MQRKPFVVLVGMDFSDLAERALRQAFELAACHENAHVHVLCVVPGVSVDAGHALGGFFVATEVGVQEGVYESLRARVRAAWQAFAEQAERPVSLSAEQLRSHVRVDSPALGIVRLASEVSADLIVVGTHGRQNVPRLLMGSVAENTVRYAPCPVLVIPAETRPSRLPQVIHVSAP
jgi:nucleotide-binding universal stress UspA family protein